MDLKHMDSARHEQLTGVPNEKILENIRHLAELPAQAVIRIPVVGGVNDGEDNIRRSAAFVQEHLPKARMELLPYHTFGQIKYEAVGLPFDQEGFTRPTPDRMDRLRKIVEEEGVPLADFR